MLGPPGVFVGPEDVEVGSDPPPDSLVFVGVRVGKNGDELVPVGDGVSAPSSPNATVIGVGVSIAAAVASRALIVPETAAWNSASLKPAGTTCGAFWV